MTKETENLLKKYWYKGYRFIFMSKDNDIFVTKQILGFNTDSNYIFSKTCSEVVLLPINELKSLFTDKTKSINISDVVNIVDWSTLEVDTPVIIRRRGTHIILKRYFKEFNPINDRVGVFSRGCTSWSNDCGFADYYDIDEVTLAEVEND